MLLGFPKLGSLAYLIVLVCRVHLHLIFFVVYMVLIVNSVTLHAPLALFLFSPSFSVSFEIISSQAHPMQNRVMNKRRITILVSAYGIK